MNLRYSIDRFQKARLIWLVLWPFRMRNLLHSYRFSLLVVLCISFYMSGHASILFSKILYCHIITSNNCYSKEFALKRMLQSLRFQSM
jgi:hypothetical protein